MNEPLSTEEVRSVQRPLFIAVGVLAAVAFFGALTWKELTRPTFGAPCTDEESCRSGPCVHRAIGPMGLTSTEAYCSKPCRDPSDCPTGFVCEDILSVPAGTLYAPTGGDGGDVSRACVRRAH